MIKRSFKGVIWNVILSSKGESLVLDVRDEKRGVVKYWNLELETHDIAPLDIEGAGWWSSIEAYDGGVLFISEYQDQKDPNNKRFFSYGDKKREIEPNEVPKTNKEYLLPFVYEQGTEHHITVASFLGLTLPLSCEYLEIDNKIIMSYYLRSDNGFDRYLLLIKEGKKALKELQDEGMKGFASGSFFVFLNQVFFIRNRNEICIYSL